MKKGPITGTFIDEITWDIPSSNWSRDQWRADFDNMQAIGIDTMIFIRGGYGDKTVFPSKTIGTPYADDFAGFVFEEASKRGMEILFGLYHSKRWDLVGNEKEIQKNKAFIDEVYERYGHYPAFKGWYLPHEVSSNIYGIGELMRALSGMCKDKTPDKNVLISPYFKTEITSKEILTPEQTFEVWDEIFAVGAKDVDICAFQDGTAPLSQMDDYYGAILKACRRNNMQHWVNTETFERDVRCMYYPIPFQDLVNKLEHHKNYADKIITFEFSHFLSPQSIYPSAKNLNALYVEKYIK